MTRAQVTRVTDIRFAAANAVHQSKGLLGWVCCDFGRLRLDCLRVRREGLDRYTIGFPTRTDAYGGMSAVHPALAPADRESVERAVIADLRRRGVLS